MGKRSNNDHHDHDDDDVGESPVEKEYPLVVLLLSFTAPTLVIFSLLAKFHQDEPLASSGLSLSLSLSLSHCPTVHLSTWLTVCDFELTFHSLFLSSTYLFTTSSENY